MKTFAEHLQELKGRIIIVAAALGLGSILGFMIHKPVEQILQKPLNETLYYSNPAGGLSFVMQIAIGVGVIVALPVIFFELMQFFRPAIKPLKSRHLIAIVVCALALTALGIAYAYFISLPSALHFLVTFNSKDVQALISVNDYMQFLTSYMLGTIVAFQIPLILFFANKIRRFPPGTLLKMQRPAIVGTIIFSGVITPTVDPINQMVVAVPIMMLFEIGAFTVFISNRRHKPLPKFEVKMPEEFIPITIPLESKPEVIPAVTTKPVPVTAIEIEAIPSHATPIAVNAIDTEPELQIVPRMRRMRQMRQDVIFHRGSQLQPIQPPRRIIDVMAPQPSMA